MSSAKQWKGMLCFLKLDPKDSIYKEKRMGPRMEPWGTPQVSGAAIEQYSLRWTEKILSVRYDWNHLTAVPLMPMHCSRHDKRILWSTVSKAAVRSRSTRIAELPESTVKRRSLNTLKRAVSVLWRDLNPDWNFSQMPWLSKNVCSWIKTTLSRDLDRKGSLEIGLKLDKTEGSRLFFLIRGCTTAC